MCPTFSKNIQIINNLNKFEWWQCCGLIGYHSDNNGGKKLEFFENTNKFLQIKHKAFPLNESVRK